MATEMEAPPAWTTIAIWSPSLAAGASRVVTLALPDRSEGDPLVLEQPDTLPPGLVFDSLAESTNGRVLLTFRNDGAHPVASQLGWWRCARLPPSADVMVWTDEA